MNIFKLKYRLMKPEEDGGTGGTAVDRGDTLASAAPPAGTQTDAEKDAAAEAERIRTEQAAADAAKAAAGTKEPTAEEVAAAAAAAADEAAKGKAAMIPVERHKAMLDKAREERDALAAQVAAFSKGQQVAVTNEQITTLEGQVVTKETEYNKLLVEGEVEKATAVMREIRSLERQMGDLKADMKAEVATANAVERVRFDTVVDRIEEAYPALKEGSDEYDQAKVAKVLELQKAYVGIGKTPSAAMQEAVTLIMGAPVTKKQEAAITVTPRVDEAAAAAAAGVKTPAELAAERTAAATAAAIAAAKGTPPATTDTGVNGDKLGGGAITATDVMKMDQKKFAGLNEETLARLRGDTI